MKRRSPSRVSIPRGMTPEQASAAIGLLERIADALWRDYGDAIWAWRDQERAALEDELDAERQEPPSPVSSGEREGSFPEL